MTLFGKNWRTSTLGALGLLALVVGILNALLDNDPNTKVDWNIALPALLAAIRGFFEKDAVVTGGTDPANAEAAERLMKAVTSAAAKGITTVAVLIAVAFALPVFAQDADSPSPDSEVIDPTAEAGNDPATVIAHAVANEPTRLLGTCNKAGTLCVGPSAVAGLLGYSFKNKEFATGLMAGACYGFERKSWVNYGADLCLNLRVGGETDDSAMISLPLSVAEYFRIGPAWMKVGGESEWLVVGMIGKNY